MKTWFSVNFIYKMYVYHRIYVHGVDLCIEFIYAYRDILKVNLHKQFLNRHKHKQILQYIEAPSGSALRSLHIYRHLKWWVTYNVYNSNCIKKSEAHWFLTQDMVLYYHDKIQPCFNKCGATLELYLTLLAFIITLKSVS